jgi:hypothetical protein
LKVGATKTDTDLDQIYWSYGGQELLKDSPWWAYGRRILIQPTVVSI